MTLYEADFKITHDSPQIRLSLKYPSIRIFVWCNFQSEIIEIVSDNTADFDKILENSEILDDVISQSSNNYNIHLLKQTCNCNLKNSIGRNAEKANVMHMNPAVIHDGWEYHRIIAFEHANLVDFVNQLDENGFTYEMEKKTPIVGQLSSSMMLNVDSVFSDLTKKQLEALITAYKYGYFVFPRRMDLQSIASKEHVVRTTLSEHLKKGQNKLFSNLIPYLYLYKEKKGYV